MFYCGELYTNQTSDKLYISSAALLSSVQQVCAISSMLLCCHHVDLRCITATSCSLNISIFDKMQVQLHCKRTSTLKQ